MKPTLLLLFVLAGLCQKSAAINAPRYIGAKSWGMAGASVGNIDAFSGFNNQAAMAFLPKPTIGFYADNRFGIADLGAQAIAVAVPTKSAALALNYQHYGTTGYNDQKIGFAVSKRFGPKIAFGVQLNYFSNRLIAQKTNSISFELAMLAKLTEKTNLGVQLFNPIQTLNADPTNNFTRPTSIRAGITHQLSPKLILAAEVEKDLIYTPNAKFGIDYRPTEMFYIRGGISTNPQLNCIGMGFAFKSFVLDIATSIHPVLRASSHASISYRF